MGSRAHLVALISKVAAATLVMLVTPGCKRPKITAVPLTQWNQCEPEGIPYYLPKPLLIIAKNFRPIDSPPIGQMGAATLPTGDAQAGYGTVTAQVNSGAAESATKASEADAKKQEEQVKKKESVSAPVVTVTTGNDGPSDLLAPEYFYTYQIVFVPDLAQKYGLRIRGGAGEFRAAMNMVNGWMFTGLGPYMFKDSSTAQNLMAGGISVNFAGRGVAEVVRSISSLGSIDKGQGLDEKRVKEAFEDAAKEMQEKMGGLALRKIDPILNYAEIHVYEPRVLPDGSMMWEPVVEDMFDRQFLGTLTRPRAAIPVNGSGGGANPGGTTPPSERDNKKDGDKEETAGNKEKEGPQKPPDTNSFGDQGSVIGDADKLLASPRLNDHEGGDQNGNVNGHRKESSENHYVDLGLGSDVVPAPPPSRVSPFAAEMVP